MIHDRFQKGKKKNNNNYIISVLSNQNIEQPMKVIFHLFDQPFESVTDFLF